MYRNFNISTVIPALNEEASVGAVVRKLLALRHDGARVIDRVIVCDNGSTDATADRAAAAGAVVVREEFQGYGAACLAAIAAIPAETDVVLFVDADRSDDTDEAIELLDAIAAGADLVVGSRALGEAEPGALTPQQRFGNWLASRLIRAIWNHPCTDLGPFRAIRSSALAGIGMRDRTYGWTVEMQVKAIAAGKKVVEIPVSYRRRVGKSKISGTIRGTIGAGTKILGTIGILALRRNDSSILCQKIGGVILFFVRYPEPGRVKTRLIPGVGGDGACRIHRRLAERMAARLRRWQSTQPGRRVQVHFAGGDEPAMEAWLGGDFDYRRQVEGDLGQRMCRAFRDAFADGATSVVAVGSDAPALSIRILDDAFRALVDTPVVLGPASDGGYYLIGLTSERHDLFQNMKWGVETVFAETVNRLKSASTSWSKLEVLDDIDRPEDLVALDRIAVIIPTLNEETMLPRVLERIDPSRHEVIISDGGSRDRTCAIALAWGARVVTGATGRGLQLNRGADEAVAETLLFLHADTLLPPDFESEVRRIISAGAPAGAFTLAIASARAGFRVIERGARWRARLLGLSYGDQGIFVNREVFDALGGFAESAIMEDFDFMLKIRRRGRAVVSDLPAATSPRRWERKGILKTTLLNQVMVLGFILGLSNRTLSRLYK